MDLNSGIENLKGVGPRLKEAFNKLDIYTIKDLMLYYPENYEFSGNNKEEIQQGITILDCIFIGFDSDKITKTGKKMTTLIFKHEDVLIYAQWFNQPYMKSKFKEGESYRLYGKLSYFGSKKIISNPKTIHENNFVQDIMPRYSANKSISSIVILKFVRQILSQVKINENLPEELVNKFRLLPLDDAIHNIHIPKDDFSLKASIYRLKFQELFIYSLKVLMIKNYNKTKALGIPFKICKELTTFRDSLPFQLTNAQRRAIREILLDQKSIYPMNRLLQGDVGSGKTVIALIALLNVLKNGYQGVMLAPTAVLAKQHYEEACKYFENYGVKIELLTGSITNKKKEDIKKKLQEGTLDLIIGTHALLEDNVEFKRLGMVVTDEQHRFGVHQRAKIMNKGENIDMLVMSATPIPRTLSLFLYGDMDISIIDELPKGRKSIKTILINDNKRAEAYKFIKEQIDAGRQAYVVCPLIEENQELPLKSAEILYEELKKEYFIKDSISILHGKMKNADKDSIMQAFKAGEIKVLISTTVIEVGINVPNASVMLIENAERFGLAQLHQLRGRVGRGEYESYCILISESKNNITKKRMKIMTENTDGFKIAEEDMKIRGTGDIFGIKQSGDMTELAIADIYEDAEILKVANQEARNILEHREKHIKLLSDVYDSIAEDTKYICLN
ncbi:ATP-dependent DNA helicase RecG [Clostridium sp. 19966]|uniref:ATP-dependent DNA helicase RecG n=1 Tax=Clostridium sp. 19966 TaxID=2768166 RepID=UPI0028E05937|nr:ATP-dependent DNA helicase RecG [Clostridium sp. 19966]MDT8716464.1 ATP-dependent DNA helicase RecG [Clostridium sp. 19966]